MWYLSVVSSKLFLYEGKSSKEVKGLKPSEAGSVLVSFEDGTRKSFFLNRFVAKSILSKKLKKFQTTRSLFCKKTRDYMAHYKSSDSSSSTDTVPETDEEDNVPSVEDHAFDSFSSQMEHSESSSTSTMSACDREDNEVLPPLPVKTDYLYEKKIKGHSVKVHLMNLAQPVRERRVRDLNTAHVHALSKSFLESPGGEFQLLAGNILSGDLENAMQERGMRIEVIGGNHTKAALMTLYRQGLRNPYVQMTLYEGLTDEEALKVGLHHNETNLKAKPMSFLDKVDVIVKLKQDIKAVASVFQKKNGRQVRNDLGVHMAVSRWPNEIIERLHQADQKWCPKKPLSQTLLRGLIKHSEMRKYMDKGTEILVQEGVQAFKEKMNQWMQVEGVGHFRNKKPTEAKGKTTVKETVKETNEKEHSVKQNYQVGDVVMAKWKDGRKYDAVIKRVEISKKIVYHVQYLEDNVQRKVSETDIEEKDIQ